MNPLVLYVVVSRLEVINLLSQTPVLLLETALVVAYLSQLYHVLLHFINGHCWDYFQCEIVNFHLLKLALLQEKHVGVENLLLLVCGHV